MSYTTYLFDFDYTLADSSRGIVTCFRNVLTRHGYTNVTDEEIKRTIGKTLEDSFSILTGVTDAAQLAGFREEYRKEADTHMTVNTVLFLETKSVLVALKDAGARIGIISTKYRYRIKELLDQHFPGNFMDIIVGGEDVKAAKPSPEGLLYAIKQLHTTKAETLYIGDSTVDAETAQNAGVDFAGVTHGVTTAQELSKYPHWKIMSTLDELLDGSDKQPSIPDSEKIPLPENDSPAPRKRKTISVWQILLLAFFLWLTYEEMGTSETWVFAILFILTLWGILQKRRILPKKAAAFLEPWLKPCRIRLRAFHIKLIRGKETPPVDDNPCTCQNCGTSYTGNFCNRCGQSRNTPRYHLSNAFKNIMGGFTNIDNGFGRTLLELLYRPGYMMRDFIGGKRVHYFRPFQTLFVLAALYIMCVQLVDPEALNPQKRKKPDNTEKTLAIRDDLQKEMEKAQTPAEKKTYALAIESLEKELASTTAKTDSTAVSSAARYTDNDNDDEDIIDELFEAGSEVTNKLEQHLQHSPFLMKVWNLMKSWGHGNKAFRIISTLPLFALATLLAFRRRKHKLTYNLTEHVFIQAFIACQILLISIIVLPFNGTARVNNLYEVSVWVIFFLFCWDYKQLYHCTWWRSFWKTLLMFFYSLILLIIFAIFVVFAAVAGIYLLKPLL